MYKKISKTRGQNYSKTLNRHESKNFSLFFRPSLRRVSTLGKVKARTHPKAFPRSPLSLSTIEKERKRDQNAPLLTTCPGVLIVLVKKKALGSSNFVLFL